MDNSTIHPASNTHAIWMIKSMQCLYGVLLKAQKCQNIVYSQYFGILVH